MSTTIDNRVVEMEFDNAHFERNVQTSLGTIEKLKQSLNFTGVSKGFENIESSSKNVNMSGLSSAVETIGLKFNAMYSIADQALRNITNSAMAAGKRIVSALTIDPIKTGFSEYETQINAVQTILANTESKGTTLDDVNGALDTLNAYADKTIYNFTEMTRNIGTFTAAGVDLDTSVNAIQGIANLAAVSGSTSQQASTAMYQLSQALASGTVKLMDWNSVVNAGMGGQVFQDALKETARVHGIAIDDMITKNGSFRETLSEGWLTSEILTETLQKFTLTTEGLTEAQIAENRAMLKAKGYTDEQIDAIFKLGDTATSAATKVKTFTQLWDTLKEAAQSGWTQTWEIIVGDFEEAKELLTKISDVIGNFIGKTAEARNNLLQGWKDAGGRADLIDAFANAFEALLSVLKPVKEAFEEVFPAITVNQLVGFTKGLKEFTAKLKLSETASNNLKRTFKGLFAILDIVGQVFMAIFKAVGTLFGGVTDLGGGILGITASFGDFLVGLSEAIKSTGIFNDILQGAATIINGAIKIVAKFAGWIGDIISPLFGVGDAADGMGSKVSNAFETIGSAIEECGLFKLLKSLWNGIMTIATGLTKALDQLVSGITKAFGGNGLVGVFDAINTVIAGGVGIGIIKFLKSMTNPFESFSDLMDGLTGILDGVRGCFEAYQTQLKAGALLKIASAIGILAVSLLLIASIDGEKLSNAIGAITVLFAELLGSMSLFAKISGEFSGVTKACAAMIVVSTSVLILASALKKVAGLEPEQMLVGLAGIAGLMLMLVGVAEILGHSGKVVIKGATQMILFATAIKILASACKSLAVLEWEEMAKGLTGVGALLLEMVAFTKLLGSTKGMLSTGIAMIGIAASMKIFASAMRDMAALSWEGIAKGLVAMGGALAGVTIALNLIPKGMMNKALGLIGVAAALLIVASVFEKLGGMSWEGIAKGLVAIGGAMLILAVGLHAMKGTLSGTASLLVASAALTVLVGVLSKLGNMKTEEIVKSLISLAAAFAVVGIAAYALSPIIPAILSLAGAMALIGVSILAAGLGLLALGAGLTAVAAGLTALIASLGAVAVGLVDIVASIITGVIKGLGNGIIALCEVVAGSGAAIFSACSTLIVSLCDALMECAPVLADTCLKLIVTLMESLVAYTPTIIDLLFQFVVGILDGFAKNIPPLVKSAMNLIGAFFSGVLDALGSIDTSTLIEGIGAVGLIAGVIAALAAITPLIPAALVGVAGMGAVITELAIVLTAIGALAQIPGLTWLIDEGAEMLYTIGNALGGFVGGILGGIAEGITASLPQIGTDLSDFMTNLQPFIDGVKQIDESVLSSTKTLMGVILALTGMSIVEGLTSWISGGSSLTKFGEELADFGPNVRLYADAVSGIDATAVEASAHAAKALAEMTSIIPNEGGMVAWFTGENSISKFGQDLIPLGEGLKGFSNSVAGIVPENIIGAATAAKALVDMTSSIPNEGGVASWFAGENSISKFGSDLISLGMGLKGFSVVIAGIVPENLIAAANAAKALSDMTSSIPNEGGLVAWFTGENSVSRFADDLINLGMGLKGFSIAITGVVPENLIAAANAAKALAEMTTFIPNEGGMVAWFTGDNSVSSFASRLPVLGAGLKGFSDSIMGVVPENIVAAANAAKSLAEMASIIPNEGGMAAWFTGENSVANFGSSLISLGMGLKGFAIATVGINPEGLSAATSAAKSLADMASVIPNQGGMAAWFTGESSVAKFGSSLTNLGKGLKGFATETADIKPENVTAAANAAKALAEMTSVIPKEGGVAAWFTGENSISKFAGHLPNLGKGLTGFSNSVADLKPENVTAAANAAKALADMTNSIPKNVGKIGEFGKKITDFGKKLAEYFSKVSGITSESISSSKKAINAVKDTSGVDAGKVKTAAKAIEDIAKALKDLAKVPKNCTKNFSNALKELGKSSADKFLNEFKDINSDMKKAGQKAIDEFAKGVKDRTSKATNACKKLSEDCAKALKSKESSFKNAGRDLVKGFANGISSNTYRAVAKAKAMAKAAADAAKKELKIKSPSRVGYSIGGFFGIGFVNALSDYAANAYDAGSEIANSARNGLSRAIGSVADIVNTGFDTNPTIRPVVDLSSVRSSANAINGLFAASPSVELLTNVGAISARMNGRVQNGANDDIVSAIDKLRKDISNLGGDSYHIDGVTYDDGSNVANAVKTITREIRIKRRT